MIGGDGKSYEFLKVMKDKGDRELFIRQLADFDRKLCDVLVEQMDFTLRLEVHGDKGRLCHARVHSESFLRPPGEKVCPACAKLNKRKR